MHLLLLCITVGGTLISVAAALVFYLSAEKQKLRVRRVPPRTGIVAGVVLLILSGFVFRQYFGPATAVYMVCVCQMLMLSLMPAVVGYIKRKRG